MKFSTYYISTVVDFWLTFDSALILHHMTLSLTHPSSHDHDATLIPHHMTLTSTYSSSHDHNPSHIPHHITQTSTLPHLMTMALHSSLIMWPWSHIHHLSHAKTQLNLLSFPYKHDKPAGKWHANMLWTFSRASLIEPLRWNRSARTDTAVAFPSLSNRHCVWFPWTQAPLWYHNTINVNMWLQYEYPLNSPGCVCFERNMETYKDSWAIKHTAGWEVQRWQSWAKKTSLQGHLLLW